MMFILFYIYLLSFIGTKLIGPNILITNFGGLRFCKNYKNCESLVISIF